MSKSPPTGKMGASGKRVVTRGFSSRTYTGVKTAGRALKTQVVETSGGKIAASPRVIENAKRAERVKAVMRGATDSGLTLSKDGRITGRVSSELIKQAKERTGLQSDTELVEFALANVALEDNFSKVFRKVKGTIDPDLDLGF